MGFKAPRKVFRLTFADSEYEGLEVIARGASVGGMLDVQGLAADAVEGRASGAGAGMIALFTESLVSWNLTDDDDQPIPATADGIRGLDIDFVMLLIRAWASHQTEVPDPLAEGSTSGEISLVQSIPTETLSTSRAS